MFLASPGPTPVWSASYKAMAKRGNVRKHCFLQKKKFLLTADMYFPAGNSVSKRVTLHSGSPCSPSQLRAFPCKRFASIDKEMYEKFYRVELLSLEGNPPSSDSSSPYKQALKVIIVVRQYLLRI